MNSRMIEFYMKVAQQASLLSRAERLKVGSVIVKDDAIISFSWNGQPSGWDNVCEDKVYMGKTAGGWLDPDEIESNWPLVDKDGRYALKTKPTVLHAEMNSLMKLTKSTISGAGAAIFVTHAPCIECAKGIYQAGIREVYYATVYRTTDGIDFLEKCGITVEQLET